MKILKILDTLFKTVKSRVTGYPGNEYEKRTETNIRTWVYLDVVIKKELKCTSEHFTDLLMFAVYTDTTDPSAYMEIPCVNSKEFQIFMDRHYEYTNSLDSLFTKVKPVIYKYEIDVSAEIRVLLSHTQRNRINECRRLLIQRINSLIQEKHLD